MHTRSTLLATLLKAPGAISVLPGTGDRVLQIDASADGSVAVTTDNNGGIAVYDTDALKLLRIVRLGNGQGPTAISPDGSTVVRAESNPEETSLTFISVADGSKRTMPLPDAGQIGGFHPLVYRPDGSEILSLESRADAKSPSIVARDPSTGESLATHPVDIGEPDVLAISSDGSTLAVNDFTSPVLTILDANTFEPRTTIRLHGVAFGLAPDGKTVALGNDDGTVEIVDVATGERTRPRRTPQRAASRASASRRTDRPS